MLDFYCAEARLAVEIDGQSHHNLDQLRHDSRRTDWLTSQNVRVMRLSAEDVRINLEGVLDFIARTAMERREP